MHSSTKRQLRYRTPEAARIYARLAELRMSPEELAQALSRSRGTIYNVINGHSRSKKLRRKISEALGINVWVAASAPGQYSGEVAANHEPQPK